MAKQTRDEAVYAGKLADKQKDLDQKIESLKKKKEQVMTDMGKMINFVEDATSKQQLRDERDQLITYLGTLNPV